MITMKDIVDFWKKSRKSVTVVFRDGHKMSLADWEKALDSFNQLSLEAEGCQLTFEVGAK